MNFEVELSPKRFYTIGEVSRITGVRPHVLRYWETRGKILKPFRKTSRHRLYRAADIQLIFEIKRLRDEEKLSLTAMRRQIQAHDRGPGPRYQAPLPLKPPEPEGLALLRSIRDELRALKELLE
ncbi:MAG: MerR family transcriptional regulator [Thermodesulfobacteriota bacterium]